MVLARYIPVPLVARGMSTARRRRAGPGESAESSPLRFCRWRRGIVSVLAAFAPEALGADTRAGSPGWHMLLYFRRPICWWCCRTTAASASPPGRLAGKGVLLTPPNGDGELAARSRMNAWRILPLAGRSVRESAMVRHGNWLACAPRAAKYMLSYSGRVRVVSTHADRASLLFNFAVSPPRHVSSGEHLALSGGWHR